MSEIIKLHGGPKHGAEMAMPENFGHSLVIEVLTHTKGIPMRRKGIYTRVNGVGRPTNDFEWSGFTEPAQPLETP